MPTTIPYDPSLVLGNIVEKPKFDQLKAIAQAQAPLDAAQEELNSLILWKRSLDMTVQELINMNVTSEELKPLNGEIDTLKKSMVTAATKLGSTTITAQQKIATLKAKEPETKVAVSVESPIDYNKSQLKTMPLSSDSIIMDAQYFRFEENKDTSDSHASAIASYVSMQSSSIFGISESSKLGGSVKQAAANQAKNHKIEGTLVITANCTHKQAEVFAPFIIDPDKAILAWNAYVPGSHIDMDDVASVVKMALDPKADTAQMQLLSGATFGSSFVGMVHVLQVEDSKSSQSSNAAALALTQKMELGGWFAKEKGEFGVDANFANSVKNLLSTSNLTSHCSLVTMGLIPTIKSNKVTTVVEKLVGDPKSHMAELANIQGATNTDLTTVASAASTARNGRSLTSLSTDWMKAAVDAVGQIDNKDNQIIDTNSLMTAFDDYVAKAAAGKCGVPINYYLKPITQRELAKAWVNKYYPGEFRATAPAGDDPGTGSGTSTGTKEKAAA